MGIFNFTPIQDGDEANMDLFNSRFLAIADILNGAIDSNNLADNAVTGAKIASGAVTATKIADDSITPTKFASASGIWQELGRTTLTAEGDTVTVSGLANMTYLKVSFKGIAIGGVVDSTIRFNNDTNANYAARYDSGGVHANTQSVGNLPLDSGTIASGGIELIDISILNVAGFEKVFNFQTAGIPTTGAGTAPSELQGVGKWANTVSTINRIDIINTNVGNFGVGTQMIVYGRN